MIRVFGENNFIDNSMRVNDLEMADIIVLPGGADINPKLYGHPPDKSTFWNDNLDSAHKLLVEFATENERAIVAICRGMQLLTALAGGYLIQDMVHPSVHLVKTVDGEEFYTNSYHHQMAFPFEMKNDDYELLGWTEEKSPYHIVKNSEVIHDYPDNSLDDEGKFKEPEIIFYNKLNALCMQFHPEWMETTTPAVRYINNEISKRFNFK